MFETLDDLFNANTPASPGTVLPSVDFTSGGFGQIAAMFTNAVIGLAFGFGMIGLAYSMVLYVTSGGSPDKTKTAWNAFIYSFVAVAVAVGTLTLRKAVLNGFGISGTGLDEGTVSY